MAASLFDPGLLKMIPVIDDLEIQRDWRVVNMAFVLELEGLARKLVEMGLWHMGIGTVGPLGEEKPVPSKAGRFLSAAADIIRSTTIAKKNIELTKTIAGRRREVAAAITDALSDEESAESVEKWKLKRAALDAKALGEALKVTP